jgi:thiamine biosynthesis lipoprotein
MMKEYKANARLMGSAFEFILCAKNDRNASHLLNQCIGEVRRIETLLTEFSKDSETAMINAAAGGEPVGVSAETYQLIERSRNISELTDGAFDISSGLLKKLYPFGKVDFTLPSARVISEALKRTGYRKISLSGNNRVQLGITGMHIGFGAIGKGYAADRVKSLMLNEGVDCGVINASGDLTAWGTRPNGVTWKAGIADPDDPEKIICWLPLNGLSIATSGNYEQYFDVNGTRFSHNIDPKTGYPVRGIRSVSIVGPAAELCDALATAVTVMGVEAGLHLIDQLPQTHCIIIDENNHSFHSKQIHVNLPA